MYSKAEPHNATILEENKIETQLTRLKKHIILQKSDVISLHSNSMKSH